MHPHALQKHLTEIWPELIKRYGENPGEYTRLQIKATADALSLDGQLLPYLYATFLSKDEYKAVQAELPGVDWTRLEQEAQAAYDAVQHLRLPGSNFHESWKGVYGG